MLGYCRDKFQCTEVLEVFFIGAVTHLRAIDDRFCTFDIAQLAKREGVADNVMGQVFYTFGITWLKPYFIVDAEPGIMTPGHDHLDKRIIDSSLLLQHFQHRSPKEFAKWT